MANLARYHRKSCPKKKHDNYRNINSKKHRKVVEQLSPLLRLAVALDRRQLGAIQTVQCDYRSDTKQFCLHIRAVHPDDDCALEFWSLDYKKDCFEEEFGIKLIPILEAVPITE
jgi:exopolyphosphatase/guanosine-5'-triphosphate,3'-diphosphate pyrophosphatase